MLIDINIARLMDYSMPRLLYIRDLFTKHNKNYTSIVPI
jgi:hypothetical protein